MAKFRASRSLRFEDTKKIVSGLSGNGPKDRWSLLDFQTHRLY